VLGRGAAQHGSIVPGLAFAQQLASVHATGSSPSSNPDNSKLGAISVDYPEEGSILPPGITPPTFLWRDSSNRASVWTIDVAFTDGGAGIRAQSAGERLGIGEIDLRCVSATNEFPKLTPQQAAAHTWIPDSATWQVIQRHSVEHPATITITGFEDEILARPVSRGAVRIVTSKDPVGAPIFFRDVPLMPAETEKGVIKPLAQRFLPLVAWRLRDIAEPRSRLLLTGMHTCANCHSFSLDGKTLGMDIDGPANDKGLYALTSIQPEMAIRNQDVISWSSLRDETVSPSRVGFMSQVSPDGRYVLTMLRGLDKDSYSYYVVNFKDYRFLQVFYPTRGTLAWYDRATSRRRALPGADDRRYVQTDAVWSPDGRYVVFARGEAKEPYIEGQKLPDHANDPEEAQIQYDLYRIPFNAGQGGQPVPIAGASRNGMSNTFPKVSPDGRWIVFVKCRNGQLMRPDSQLYIVPAEGGAARRMRCNTPLMNSWHSFSPNGRWLVFSSKNRSPYTQLFLTHLDEDGNDSPPILIENTTAANRAANIPEFVNIPPDGMTKIDVPAADSYRLFDIATDLTAKGQVEAGIAEWKEVLELDPRDAKAHNNLGAALLRQGNLAEAMTHFQKALEVDPDLSQAQGNWGIGLFWEGKLDEAMPHLQRAVEINAENAIFYEKFISSLDPLATTPQAGLELEDVSPQAKEGSLGNASPRKRGNLDAQYRRRLNAVLAYIMASDDPARPAVRKEDVPNQPNLREPLDVLGAPSAFPDSTQPGGSSPEIEKLIADLDIPWLRRLAEQDKNADESFAAQRQILLIFLQTFEASNILLGKKRNAQALMCLEIAAQAAPRNPLISYDLARAQALTRQPKRALKTLQAAAEKGFNDADQVEGDRAFEGLRTQPDYQKALAEMRGGKPRTEAVP
jgi:Tol biopolymer transport system component/predicted negative regulator of RcsB-dependent stress response